MPTFEDMKRRTQNYGTIGQQIKKSSDFVMQQTFQNDVATRQCYIYDYYHDDQPEQQTGYDPSLSRMKVPVKLKFIIKEYKSAAKDDPEYHIQFEPDVWNSMSCKPQWFVDGYEKYGVQFPVGLYVDIPDDRGVYWKWIVFYNEVANQFPKFGVVKCNYNFQWVADDGVHRYIRKMWGVERTQNSYTSGTWLGNKMLTFDEQGKFWLPWNYISSEIKHDMRLFISMLQPEPYVYIISKVKNTASKGIITLTVEQVEFNQFTDYVNLETGEMLADYYKSTVEPEKNQDENQKDNNTSIFNLTLDTSSYDIGIGSKKHIVANILDEYKNILNSYVEDFEWIILLDDQDITDNKKIITSFEQNENDLLFTFIDDDTYVDSVITIICKYGKLSKSMNFSIVY